MIKRYLLVFFTLLLLLCPLSACRSSAGSSGGTTEPDTVVPSEEIDLCEYVIIRPADADEQVMAAAVKLRTAIRNQGISIMIEDDGAATGTRSDGKKELLIGKTNRAESAALASEAPEESWIVGVENGKLVIWADRNVYLDDAVEYVTGELLRDGSAFSVSSRFRHISEQYPVLNIVKDGKSSYKIIRTEDTANYITDLALSVRSVISEVSGVEIPVEYDMYSDPADADAWEILIGQTNRAQSADVLNDSSVDSYSVSVVGHRIVLNSYSLNGTIKAVEEFNELLRKNADEKKDLILPEKLLRQNGSLEGVRQVPAPEGLSVTGAYRGLDDTFERIYGGATEQNFSAYCSVLEQKGYTLYDENRIAQNLFAVYTKGNETVYVSFQAFDSSLRIISETVSALLPVQASTYEKVTDSALMQISFDDEAGNFGMGYVITLEDGSYLIVDGGGANDGDAEKLFGYLSENNRRADGRIVISAWILTHEHSDHIGGFLSFAQKYAGNVTLERLLWNMVPYYEAKGYAGAYYGKIQNAAAAFGNVELIKIHAGQKAVFANAEIDFLFTPEQLAPYRIIEMNETSLVFRVKISDKTVLFLADISTMADGKRNSAASLLFQMYGAELKSDICQIGHHGWNGGSVDIYNAVAPDIILWPVEESRWEKVSQYSTSKHLLKMVEDGIIKQMYVAKDGQVILLLKAS